MVQFNVTLNDNDEDTKTVQFNVTLNNCLGVQFNETLNHFLQVQFNATLNHCLGVDRKKTQVQFNVTLKQFLGVDRKKTQVQFNVTLNLHMVYKYGTKRMSSISRWHGVKFKFKMPNMIPGVYAISLNGRNVPNMFP